MYIFIRIRVNTFQCINMHCVKYIHCKYTVLGETCAEIHIYIYSHISAIMQHILKLNAGKSTRRVGQT